MDSSLTSTGRTVSSQGFSEVDLKVIEEHFFERLLAQVHKQEIITDDDVAQIGCQDHTCFGVWMGDLFYDKESELFIARYIECAPYPLRSSQSKMTSLPRPLRKGRLIHLRVSSLSLNAHVTFRKTTKVSHDTTHVTHDYFYGVPVVGPVGRVSQSSNTLQFSHTQFPPQIS